MKKIVLFSLVLMATLYAPYSSFSQADNFAYAVTDVDQSGGGWNVLRKFNLKTGQYSDILLNGLNQNYPAFDATSKRQIQTTTIDARLGNYLVMPFNTGVAALAYDKRSNRIFYTPMFIDQLRYIDLNTMKLYYITDQSFTSLGSMHGDDGKSVSRMVITPDGDG